MDATHLTGTPASRPLGTCGRTETRGQTGRSPVSQKLRNKRKAVLPGVGCGLFRPSSFAGSQIPQSRLFECSNEFAGGWPTHYRPKSEPHIKVGCPILSRFFAKGWAGGMPE